MTQPRQPKGTPHGGEFGPKKNAEPSQSIDDLQIGERIRQRADALIKVGQAQRGISENHIINAQRKADAAFPAAEHDAAIAAISDFSASFSGEPPTSISAVEQYHRRADELADGWTDGNMPLSYMRDNTEQAIKEARELIVNKQMRALATHDDTFPREQYERAIEAIDRLLARCTVKPPPPLPPATYEVRVATLAHRQDTEKYKAFSRNTKTGLTPMGVR